MRIIYIHTAKTTWASHDQTVTSIARWYGGRYTATDGSRVGGVQQFERNLHFLSMNGYLGGYCNSISQSESWRVPVY